MFCKPFSYHKPQLIPSLLPLQSWHLYANQQSAILLHHRPKHNDTLTQNKDFSQPLYSQLTISHNSVTIWEHFI